MTVPANNEPTISTEIIFEGRIINVRVDTVQLVNGRTSTREIAEHSPSICVVPVDADGNVLLVRQYRYAAGCDLLEAPAGLMEEAETAEECAQRELREETGYGAGELTPIGGFWPSPGFCTEFMHLFLARDLAYDRLEPDDDEDITLVTLPLSEAVELVRKGEIRDAKTICALLLAERICSAP
jgi:ADP-ribose pyrophosphatase